MITITKTYKFPGSASATEVTYTWTTNNTCASITPSSGTVAPGTEVEFTFTFASESCFTTQFTLTSYDDVCSNLIKQIYSYANPCSTLTGTLSNTPSSTNPYIYTVQPEGGVGPYTYSWGYNTALFEEITGLRDSPDEQLALRLKDEVAIVPNVTDITVTITDSNGCSETLANSTSICQPIASNQTVTTTCIASTEVGSITATSSVGGVQLIVSECAGTALNWTTLELDYDTTKLHVVHEGSGVLTIYGIGVTTQAEYSIVFSVKNDIGTESTQGTVSVVIPVCTNVTDNSGPVFTSVQATKFLTGEGGGTVKSLALEPIIFSQ